MARDMQGKVVHEAWKSRCATQTHQISSPAIIPDRAWAIPISAHHTPRDVARRTEEWDIQKWWLVRMTTVSWPS